MVMQVYAVRIEDGELRSLDGIPVPRRADAVLIVLPEPGVSPEQDEWLRPFQEFLETLAEAPPAAPVELSGEELERLIHASRQ